MKNLLGLETVTIIGCGVAGLSVGFRLLQSGTPVEFIGRGVEEDVASRCAIGISSAKGLFEPKDPLFAIKLMGHEYIPGWIKEIEKASGKYIQLNQTGGVFERPENHQSLINTIERVYKREFTGFYRVEIFKDRIFYPKDYFFNPDDVLKGLDIANQKMGALYIKGSVEGLKESADGLEIHMNNTILKRKIVVVAAGFGALHLLAPYFAKKAKFFGVGGLSLKVELEKGLNLFPTTEFAEVRNEFGLVAFDRNLRIGSTSYMNSYQLDRDSQKKDVDKLLAKFLGGNVSKLKSARVAECWGVRARFRDRHPRFGLVRENERGFQLWTICGLYKSGFQLADILARELVSLMKNRKNKGNDIRDSHAALFKHFRWENI